MAKLIISLQEICDLLKQKFPQNNKFKLTSIEPQNKDIILKVKLGILPAISVKLLYGGYQAGVLYFKLESNKIVTTLLEMIKTQPIPWLKLQGDNLLIHVEQLIQSKMPGFSIDQIDQDDDGNFVVEFNIDEILV